MGFFDFLGAQPRLDPATLVPKVHSRFYLEMLGAQFANLGVDPFHIHPVGDWYGAAVGTPEEDGIRAVSLPRLKKAGISPDAALARAVANVKGRLRVQPMAAGVFSVDSRDCTAGAALLPGALDLGTLGLKGRPVAILINVNRLMLAGEDDVDALLALAAGARVFVQADGAVSLVPVVLTPAGPQPWPPSGHDLEGVFNALCSVTQIQMLRDVVNTDPVLSGIGLAHMAPLPPAKGGGIVAAWARGTDVIICSQVERVVLLDTAAAELPRVEVRLSSLLEAVPDALEVLATEEGATGNDAPASVCLAAGARFPSPRVMRFLAARGALEDSLDPQEGTLEPRSVPVQKLLAAWDGGVPILAVTDGDAVKLVNPDGRTALTSMEEFLPRLEALPLVDQYPLLADALLMVPEDTTPRLAKRLEEVARVAAWANEDVINARDEKRSGMKANTLYPVLRTPGHAVTQQANMEGMVMPHMRGKTVTQPQACSQPFAHGCLVEVVQDAGDRVLPLNAMNFDAARFPQAHATALLNLEAASLEGLIPVKPGVFQGPWKDGFGPSRLLLPQVFGNAQVAGERLIFVPHTSVMWVTGSQEVEGLAWVLARVEEFLASGGATHAYAWRDLFFGLPWVLGDDGQAALWTPPASHPLAQRMLALHANVEARRNTSAMHARSLASQVQMHQPQARGVQ